MNDRALWAWFCVECLIVVDLGTSLGAWLAPRLIALGLLSGCIIPDRIGVSGGYADHPFWKQSNSTTSEFGIVQVYGEWDVHPQKVIVVERVVEAGR